jgi:hypothetical protein
MLEYLDRAGGLFHRFVLLLAAVSEYCPRNLASCLLDRRFHFGAGCWNSPAEENKRDKHTKNIILPCGTVNYTESDAS